MSSYKIRASYVQKAIMVVVAAMIIAFAAEFVRELYVVFGNISSAANFFGSADVLMYLTIEFLFLMTVVAAGFFALSGALSNR